PCAHAPPPPAISPLSLHDALPICWEDLLDLDLTSPGEPVAHPLLLVCAHGKHDRCCARLGRPLYEALAEQAEEGWVWQCSSGRRSEEHTSELQSLAYLVCRLLLEK